MIGDAPADGIETIELRDLTGHVGTALSTDEASWVDHTRWRNRVRRLEHRRARWLGSSRNHRHRHRLWPARRAALRPRHRVPDAGSLARRETSCLRRGDEVDRERAARRAPRDRRPGRRRHVRVQRAARRCRLGPLAGSTRVAARWLRTHRGRRLRRQRPAVPSRPRWHGDAADRRPRRLLQRLRRPTTAGGSTRCGRRSTPHPHRCASRRRVPTSNRRCCAVPPRAAAPRLADRGVDDGRRRSDRARVARAARWRERGFTGAAGAVDSRRPVGLVERVVVAVEPVAAGRRRLRGAAARSRVVDRLRPGVHRSRMGSVGRSAVHRSDGHHRRRRTARRHRRDAHRGDGRLVRRLHGQLGRHPHRPLQGHRHPRQPVGARAVRRRRPTRTTTGGGRSRRR